jgi:hypothetical protein
MKDSFSQRRLRRNNPAIKPVVRTGFADVKSSAIIVFQIATNDFLVVRTFHHKFYLKI